MDSTPNAVQAVTIFRLARCASVRAQLRKVGGLDAKHFVCIYLIDTISP